MPKFSIVNDTDPDDLEDVYKSHEPLALICPVWAGGCEHQCELECRDADLIHCRPAMDLRGERGYTDKSSGLKSDKSD